MNNTKLFPVIQKMKIEVTKFTLVGAVNFVLTFVVFFFLVKIIKVNYLISLTVAWIIGILFSYIFNFVWVFKPEQRLQFKDRFIKYFAASLISFALNLLILDYIVEHSGFDPFYVQTALIPFIVIFNFTTAKFWSLRTMINTKGDSNMVKEKKKIDVTVLNKTDD